MSQTSPELDRALDTIMKMEPRANPVNELEKLAIEHMLGSEDFDDLVHDAASSLASNINNQGLAAQIEFVLAHHSSRAELEKFIKDEK